MNNMKIVALIPIRHHSQRVPGKNYRPLAGKPLFHHILSTLLACPEISQVVVDTDSPPVMEGLRQHFPSVRILERPEVLRADSVPMNEYREVFAKSDVLRRALEIAREGL